MSTNSSIETGRGPSVLGFIGQILAWVVILGVAAMITVAVLIPRVGGATPYTILTSSMEPLNPPGTLMVMKPTAMDNIRVGDVITYQLKSGEPTVVTHRVVQVEQTLNGQTRFITKGDNNMINDAEPVMPVQVRGKLWYRVPFLGRVNTMLSGNQRQTATVIVAGSLFLYAGYMFAGSLRDRTRRGKRPVTHELAA